ncbi:Fe-S cluster assembly iron-binding protein IscA [Hathewaya limosa]|uniref:Fe-S cluster assembly iron-binding protein IscA n=1 Tax=Hathewaya limosa TaxID=1536 RepID=A0ABU0JR86_HATLI|nr:Fe-S cluster assembly iron-binding protein IscA [Hathewaya limosa]
MKIYLTNSAKSDLSKLLSDKNNKEYIRISKKTGNV